MKKLYFLTVLILLTAFIFIFKSKSFFSETKGFDVCQGLLQAEKPVCWKNTFEYVLKNNGVEKGFNYLSYLYKNDSDFSPSCHDYTHLIGEEAYKRFERHEKFNLDETASYCGYGFYHGFIISLFKDGKGKEEAANFCKYADSLTSKGTKTVVLDCYHGIGHGATDFNSDQISSFKELNMVTANTLKLCREVSNDPEEQNRCVDGVYHSILDTTVSNQKIISIFSKEGPYTFCANQIPENQKTCYGSLGFILMYLNENNFEKSLKSAQANLKTDLAAVLIRQMAGYEAYRNIGNGDLSQDLLNCKDMRTILKEECIKGLVEGVTDFGSPGNEESGILVFCQDNVLLDSEKEFCIRHAVSYFKVYFGNERKDKLCKLIDDKYCD